MARQHSDGSLRSQSVHHRVQPDSVTVTVSVSVSATVPEAGGRGPESGVRGPESGCFVASK